MIFITVLVSGVAVLSQNLTRLARWAVERSLPAASVAIKDVHFEGPDRLVVREFVLRSKASGEEVLRLEGGFMVFSFDALRRRQLGEIRLVHPVIRISPGLFAILPTGGSGGSLPPWAASRIVCDYAELLCEGFGETSPSISLKCAWDWRAPGEDPTVPLTLTAWDVQASVGGRIFATIDLATLGARLPGLLSEHQVDLVEIRGGSLTLGSALQTLFSGPPGASPATSWKLARLDIANVLVRLEDDRETAADISFQLNTTLTDLSLSQAAAAIGEAEQVVEIADVKILSPFDPFAKVLTMRRIFLRFSLSGILRNELRSVTILDPAIYVGPDLFWYMDDAQARLASPSQKSAAPAWKIHELILDSGRLILGSSGRTKYGVPLNFRARAQDIALDNLAALKLQTALEIPAQTYEFPEYQLDVSTKKGDLQFSYPPEKNENNLVGKVFFDSMRWRQFEASEAWLAATFDKTGINGDFGGKFSGGYLSGGFSFLFQEGAPWIGWLYGRKIDLRQLTNIIAPQNFSMTGPLDFRLQMDAFGRDIQRIKASFNSLRPGRLKVGKLDDLLANIPDTWSNLKQSSTRIALNALRDFDYTTANGDCWFVDDQGILGLDLQGPLGSRKFQIVLHADESKEGKWKQKP